MLGFFPELFKGKCIAGNRIHEYPHSFNVMSDICEEEYKRPEYAVLLHDYLVQEEEFWDSCIEGFEFCYNNGNYSTFKMSFDVQNEILMCLRMWIDAEKEYFFNEYWEILKEGNLKITDFAEIVHKPSLVYSGGPGGLSFSYPQWLCMMLMENKESVNEDVCYFMHYMDNYLHGFVDKESMAKYEKETFYGDPKNTLKKPPPHLDDTLKIMQGAFRFHIETMEPNVWKYRTALIEL